METGMLVTGLVVGAIFMLIGIISLKKSSKGWNFVDLILNRQGSGFGQLVSGILLIAAVTVLFILSKNGII